ncbi:MAG: SAM-dependent chlorinase/fluorinase [Bacteroidales bacterium]|nr:SAM-dependent chlorinase/fluorinase [Bacteroidales bacterium]
MSIVTLLSDWGLSDYYVAAVKGRLYSECPDLRVIDISHDLPKYDTKAAAFVLKQTYPHFPAGTVHCIGINDIATPEQPHIIVYEDNQYFIGADNGLFELLFDRQPSGAWRISLQPDGQSATFPSLNLFPLAAVHIAQGGSPDEIGEPYDWNGRNISLKVDLPETTALCGKNGQPIGVRLSGKVIYIDSYGNCVTNIPQDLFEEIRARYPRFQINIQGFNMKGPLLNRISHRYGEVQTADLCALFPDHRLLEISMNKAKADKYFALKRSIIYIDFLLPVTTV